jgi:NitT/TauT family transport system ATP-binding protein
LSPLIPSPGARSSAVGSGDIHVRGVTKLFVAARGELRALDPIDLTIPEGQFLCIVGPSGCGKTTLLRIIAGLEQPTDGAVDFTIAHPDKPLRSVVFQEQGIFPWMSVLQNTAFGLKVRGVARDKREAEARAYLDMLGLTPFAHAYPRQLSGGMRQRVNIARAFANDPAILLMDEPLASLDEQTKLLVQEDLLRLWDRSHKTVVYITHSLDEAIVLGDRVIVMTNRPGKIKTIVDIDLPRPRNVLDMQSNEAFFSMRSRIWTALREEVLTLRKRETESEVLA